MGMNSCKNGSAGVIRQISFKGRLVKRSFNACYAVDG